jgi:hypothetical protein
MTQGIVASGEALNANMTPKLLRRFAPLGLAALAIGVGVLLYRGPARPFIRGHVGDVAATMLVYAMLGVVLRGRLARPGWRAFGAMAIATALECGQRVWTGTGLAGEILVGGSFDGWDFAAYLLGTVVAVGYDVTASHRAPRLPQMRLQNSATSGARPGSSRSPSVSLSRREKEMP